MWNLALNKKYILVNFLKVISVSYQLVPEGPEALKNYLESVGYWLVSDFPREYLFARKSAFPTNKEDYIRRK